MALLRRMPFAIVLAAGMGWSAMALLHLVERRGPLAGVFGPAVDAVCAALAASVVLGAWALAIEPRAAAWRALVVAAVVSWLAFLVLVQPVEKLWIEAGIGLGFGLFALLLLCGRSFARWPARPRRALDVLAFSLCVSAIGLEVGLRLLSAARPSPLLARLDDLPEDVVDRMRRKPGEIYLGFPCNRAGHYDEEFRRRGGGERLVATIGDSFSLGIVPHPFHYTTVCERRLGAPVANLGISSTGPPEYLRMLVDEALPLDPDLVVIALFVGNDLVPEDRRSGPFELARSWLDRQRVLLWLVPRRLAALAEERAHSRGEDPVGAAPGAGVPSAVGASPESLAKSLPWLADPRLEEPSFSQANFLGGEVLRARATCRLTPAELEPLFQALLTMQRAAGPDRMCVMLIPDEFQVEDAVWDEVVAELGGIALDRDRAQALILPWLAEHGIPALDLLPRLRSVPPMEDGRRHLYHLRNTHFNARGNAEAGEALAEFLSERLAERPVR